jgi:hypothetical protein
MFVRFVVLCKNKDSGCLEGVFQAAYRLYDEKRFDQAGATRFEALLQWFKLHLPAPSDFSLRRGHQGHRQAICWFKVQATEHLGKVWELATLLERYGVPTRRLRTSRPGYLVYEDQFQVAAVPFRDSKL